MLLRSRAFSTASCGEPPFYHGIADHQGIAARALVTAFVGVACLFNAAVLQAQPEEAADEDQVQTLRVTGEFRETDLDSLPASLSVLGQAQLEQRNAQHLEQVLNMAPNLNFAAGTSRGRYFQMRGIGERSEFSEPLNASVGTLIDGVDFSGIAAVSTLYDVEQVEIFRGPQGTRYGATGLAGMINIVTNAPTDEFQAGVRTRVANYNSLGLAGFASGPLTDTLRVRIAAEQYRSDGFMKNDFLDREDTNDFDERTLRTRVLWEPTPEWRFDLSLGRIDVDNGYDAFSLDNNRRTLSDEPGHDKQLSDYAALRSTWQGSDQVQVQALMSFSDTEVDYGYDEDWTFEGFHPAGYSSTDNYQRDQTRATAELRLLSGPEGRLFSDTTDWVAGIYWYDQEVTLRRDYTFLAEPFLSDYSVRREAVFGQTESALSDRTGLTLGMRYERHRSRYSDSNDVRFSPQDDLFGAHVALDYLLDNQRLVYVSLARGYKVGGFNIDGDLDEDLRRFDPESLYNLEFGLKGGWLDDAVQGRFTLFHMWRDDAQLSTSETRVRGDGSAEFIAYKGNTGSGSRNYGLEGELLWQPWAALDLSAALGLLRAEYGSYTNAQGDSLRGRRQAHAPAYQFHLMGEYRFPGNFYTRLEVEGRDSFYFSDSHNEQSDAYELLHLTAGWRHDNWSLQIWARNLLDEDYPVRGFFFGNDPRDGYSPTNYVQLGEPRRIGLTVDWRI